MINHIANNICDKIKMNVILFGILVILCMFIALSMFSTKLQESFTSSFGIGTRMQCPTRNQSYDLRGEATVIQRTQLPFNNSGFGALNPSNCIF